MTSLSNSLMIAYQNYRLSHGMHWEKSYPTWRDIPKRFKILIVVLVFSMGFYHSMGVQAAAIETELKVEQVKQWKDAYQRVLLACLNRGGFALGNKAFGCEAFEM